jgi:O-methyltransferase involved in polyketide biosynthesis
MPRTHDDSWDLASSVGATATMVATSRALASRGPEPLLDDPFAEPLVRAVGLAPFIRILDGEVSLEDDPMLNRQTRTEQMAVRTRFFDDFFTTAAQTGVRQAVILASGLDTRAYRLPWPDGTTVYEIDQPEVIEFKTSTLAGLGATPTAELRPIAIDLRDDWPAALRAGRSTTSPRSARRAASWPPSTSPIQTPSPRRAWSASVSGGAAPVSTSTRLICSIKAIAVWWPTISPVTTGR